MLALIMPLIGYFVFAIALTWLAALARDRFEARKRRAWRK